MVKERNRRKHVPLGHCVAGIILLLVTGCQSGRIYTARNLPPEIIAPPIRSVRNVDFSQLTRAIGNSDVLQPGDLVSITITTGLETGQPPQWRGQIAADGSVNVPLVGSVKIAGLDVPQAGQAITRASIERGKFVDPSVAIVPEMKKTNRVTVVGAVASPGTYELPAGSSHLLAAIIAAKGFTADAEPQVEIRYPPSQRVMPVASAGSPGFVGYQQQQVVTVPPRTVRVDLAKATAGYGEDFHVEDGSTVTVIQRPDRYFHVIGNVKRAAQFEMPDDTDVRLLDAIAMAGDRSTNLADKIHVIRQVPGSAEPAVVQVSLRKAKRDGKENLRLAPGDVVSVEETPATFVAGVLQKIINVGIGASVPLF